MRESLTFISCDRCGKPLGSNSDYGVVPWASRVDEPSGYGGFVYVNKEYDLCRKCDEAMRKCLTGVSS